MFFIELVEGKDHPWGLEKKQFDELGVTVGLMLRMTKVIWHTGLCVIMNSGFCVLKGIIEMAKRGIYRAALIKKWCYWPVGVPGDQINQDFMKRDVGSIDALRGEQDGVPYHITCMKELDYVMKIMTTHHGTLNHEGCDTQHTYKHQDGVKAMITFKLPESVHQHFNAQHAMDDHNNKWHSPISLEETWGTKWWFHCNIAFFLGVTEVNVNLTKVYFSELDVSKVLSQIKQRKKILIEMIQNQLDDDGTQGHMHPRSNKKCRGAASGHSLNSIPKFYVHWKGDYWTQVKTEYLQKMCSCGKSMCKYCKHNRTVYLCPECYVEHKAEVDFLLIL